jgi:hypothetical protein
MFLDVWFSLAMVLMDYPEQSVSKAYLALVGWMEILEMRKAIAAELGELEPLGRSEEAMLVAMADLVRNGVVLKSQNFAFQLLIYVSGWWCQTASILTREMMEKTESVLVLDKVGSME